MPRKSVVTLKANDELVKESVEQFYLVSEMKYEIAKAAYDAQDDDTRDMIDQLVKVLNLHATGYITVQLDPPHGGAVPVKVEKRYVDFNTLYIVMDMLKTLALFDIRVGKYVFPAAHCAQCEAELIPERKHAPKARNR
jgi:hypothetical protein